jgi:protein TonB
VVRTESTPKPASPEPAAIPPPAMPALLPVADPKLDVPFPLPVKGPSRIVEASKAAPVDSSSARSAAAPVQHLTFGEGEGDQPPPEYPREARDAHQEGNVIVQWTVDDDGNVTDARVTSPCPWPILNQAALRAVRDTWHFGKGRVRNQDIEFSFQLNQR